MKKSELFDVELQNLAEIAKVLAHPARLAILQYLSTCKTCISGDITKEIPLSRTTVSQHLQELKKYDLIEGEIDGIKIHYCLNDEKLKEIRQFFTLFLDNLTEDNNIVC